jgi:hypothetical protein
MAFLYSWRLERSGRDASEDSVWDPKKKPLDPSVHAEME